MNKEFTKSFKKINSKDPEAFEDYNEYMEISEDDEIQSDVESDDEDNFSPCTTETDIETPAQSDVSDTEDADSKIKIISKRKPRKRNINVEILQEENDFLEEK